MLRVGSCAPASQLSSAPPVFLACMYLCLVFFKVVHTSQSPEQDYVTEGSYLRFRSARNTR
ncbi:hypothetical protein M434DRAFT_206461 [Hypoxylon sp. CO27-5]|nr:hypothetical protein M434DRAFT_206461 [Hypoxylon sp. CO27-5]